MTDIIGYLVAIGFVIFISFTEISMSKEAQKNDIKVFLNNGKMLLFSVDTTLEKVQNCVNKYDFIRFGSYVINTNEIVLIEKV